MVRLDQSGPRGSSGGAAPRAETVVGNASRGPAANAAALEKPADHACRARCVRCLQVLHV